MILRCAFHYIGLLLKSIGRHLKRKISLIISTLKTLSSVANMDITGEQKLSRGDLFNLDLSQNVKYLKTGILKYIITSKIHVK